MIMERAWMDFGKQEGIGAEQYKQSKSECTRKKFAKCSKLCLVCFLLVACCFHPNACQVFCLRFCFGSAWDTFPFSVSKIC